MRERSLSRCAVERACQRCDEFHGSTSESGVGFGALWPRRFFGCRLSIGPMADDRRHGKNKHDEGDMAVPAMPGAGLVVIEAELILGSLKTILDRPAMPFHRHQLCHCCALGTPSREERQIAVGDVA